METRDAGLGFGARAPAGDVEADRLELARRVAAEFAEPHDPDAHLARRGLIVVLVPDALALLALVAAQLAQVQQRVQHDPFAHARREIGSTTRTIGTSGSSGSSKR